MNKRFEEIDSKDSNVIYSHVHLVRNRDEYAFPSRTTVTRCGEMVGRLRERLKGFKDQDGRDLSYSQLDQMQELERMALGGRRILDTACVSKKEPSGLLPPANESGSIVLGGDDHIHMQILSPGLKLDELRYKADVLDDRVNERSSHAFDEKYRYLTSFPINVDTGLRACVVLYLPTLSQVHKLQSIMADISRSGTAIRGLYGEGSDNYGSLYEVSSRWALGQSEKGIMGLVTEAAAQLNSREMWVKSVTPNIQRLKREGGTYKSYGVLKYAKEVMEKGARIFISQLMAGGEDGLMKFSEGCSLYSLIIGIKPINLNLWAKQPLDKDELDAMGAVCIRQNLPGIVQFNHGQSQV